MQEQQFEINYWECFQFRKNIDMKGLLRKQKH